MDVAPGYIRHITAPRCDRFELGLAEALRDMGLKVRDRSDMPTFDGASAHTCGRATATRARAAKTPSMSTPASEAVEQRCEDAIIDMFLNYVGRVPSYCEEIQPNGASHLAAIRVSPGSALGF